MPSRTPMVIVIVYMHKQGVKLLRFNFVWGVVRTWFWINCDIRHIYHRCHFQNWSKPIPSLRYNNMCVFAGHIKLLNFAW